MNNENSWSKLKTLRSKVELKAKLKKPLKCAYPLPIGVGYKVLWLRRDGTWSESTTAEVPIATRLVRTEAEAEDLLRRQSGLQQKQAQTLDEAGRGQSEPGYTPGVSPNFKGITPKFKQVTPKL